MSSKAIICLSIGVSFLILTVVNSFTEEFITPSYQRAELLAGITSTCLMLVAFLWTEPAHKKKISKYKKNMPEGLVIADEISETVRNELGWGSQLLLTATPAVTLLVYWDRQVLIRRGILGCGNFIPGSTCLEVTKSEKLLSLPNTKFFPAKTEFDSILEGLPSLIVSPLEKRGWLVLGGNTEKCFSISDEKWIKGWSERLTSVLLNQIN